MYNSINLPFEYMKAITFVEKFIKSVASQCKLRNLFNISTLLKIAFMYSITIIVLILTYFDYSPNVISDNKAKIAIYSSRGRIGEHQTYLKMIRLFKKLGIGYIGCSYNESLSDYFLTRHFYISANYIMHQIIKPQFSISLTHHVKIVPPGISLVYLNVPDLMLFGKSGKFSSPMRHLKNYTGYIDLYSFVHGNNPDLQEVLEKEGRSNAPIFPAFLAQDSQEVGYPSAYRHAVVTGTLWGCNRSSYRLISALKRLAANGDLKAYGMGYAYDFLGSSYMGSLEKYGKPESSVLQIQNEGGISIIFHNFEHMVQSLPTSRFAESIVAKAVLISDHNPFLKKYFGDNILYFDSFASSAEIHNQLKQHIDWIKNNPEKARDMSEKAYEIFTNKLALEVQLPQLLTMVEKYLK